MARESVGRFIVFDLEPVHFEQQLDRVADRLVIIDDEDLGRGISEKVRP